MLEPAVDVDVEAEEGRVSFPVKARCFVLARLSSFGLEA